MADSIRPKTDLALSSLSANSSRATHITIMDGEARFVPSTGRMENRLQSAGHKHALRRVPSYFARTLAVICLKMTVIHEENQDTIRQKERL